MGFFTYLSKKKWLKYVMIALMGGVFIFAQAGSGFIHYLTDSTVAPPDMAVIAGKKVDLQDYHRMLSIVQQELLQQGHKREKVNRLAHIYTWDHFLSKYMYAPIYRELGLEVSPQEEVAILEEGRDISFFCSFARPYVADIPQFQDKQGNFDKSKWIRTLSDLAKTKEGKARIKSIEAVIKPRRLTQKLITLVKTTIHTSRLEAAQYPAEENLNVSCLYIPYTSIVQVQDVTKEEKEDYLKKNTARYQVKAAREIKYVVIPFVVSKEDEALFREELEELVLAFAKTDSPENFAKRYTEQGQEIVCTWTKSTMPPLIAAQLPHLVQGKVVGPLQDGNKYHFYRLISYSGDTYKVARLEKRMKVSEYAVHECLKEAETFKELKSLKAFQNKAKEKGLETEEFSFTKKDLEFTLGQSSTIRRIQRWLFDPNTKVNSVSSPMEEEDGCLVCIMKAEMPAGTVPLEKIGPGIEAKIRAEKAGRQISEKLSLLLHEDKSLKGIAEAYGKEAKVYTFEIKDFDQNELKSLGFAPKVIGSAFGLKVGERTGIIADSSGIFIVQRLPDRAKKMKGKMLISKRQEELYKIQEDHIFREVYDKCWKEARIEDNRHVYF